MRSPWPKRKIRWSERLVRDNIKTVWTCIKHYLFHEIQRLSVCLKDTRRNTGTVSEQSSVNKSTDSRGGRIGKDDCRNDGWKTQAYVQPVTITMSDISNLFASGSLLSPHCSSVDVLSVFGIESHIHTHIHTSSVWRWSKCFICMLEQRV